MLPIITPPESKKFDYFKSLVFDSQMDGIFWMGNKNKKDVSLVNTFKNNRFRKVTVLDNGIYTIYPEIDMGFSYKDIRYMLEGNSYH